MKFLAVMDVLPGRIRRDAVYQGNVVWTPVPGRTSKGLRIAVYDDRGEWMTYDPAAFMPAEQPAEAKKVTTKPLTKQPEGWPTPLPGEAGYPGIAVQEVTDLDFDKEVRNAKVPVLLHLWAPWCGPCRIMGPVLSAIAKEFTGRVKVVKLNTDENTRTPILYKVSAIPTLLILKDGNVMDTLIGVHPRRDLQERLNKIAPKEKP